MIAYAMGNAVLTADEGMNLVPEPYFGISLIVFTFLFFLWALPDFLEYRKRRETRTAKRM